MIQDALLIFDPAGTAITTTATSTNVLDLLNKRDLGIGSSPDEPNLMVTVGTTFAGGTSINVQFQTSPDNSTWTTAAESGVIALANLVAGARLLNIPIPSPAPGAALPRYYRLNYVVVGTMTAGTVTSELLGILDEFPQQAAGYVGGYPPGVVVYN